MIEFAWFYILKIAIVAVFLFFIAKPFYAEWQDLGTISFVGKKVPIILAILLVVLIAFSPVKIDNSTSADRLRQSYDPIATEQIEEIKKHDLKKYSPDSNEDDIKRILEN